MSDDNNIGNAFKSPQYTVKSTALSNNQKNYIISKVLYIAKNSPEKLLELQYSSRFHQLIKKDPTILPDLLSSLSKNENTIKTKALDVNGQLLIKNFTRLNEFDAKTFNERTVLEHGIEDLSENDAKNFYNKYIGDIPEDKISHIKNFKQLIQKKGLSNVERALFQENNYAQVNKDTLNENSDMNYFS